MYKVGGILDYFCHEYPEKKITIRFYKHDLNNENSRK